MRRSLRRRTAGLTLIELLVVMLILVILATSVSLYVVNKTDQARRSRAVADLQTFSTALDLYHTGMGEYPSTEQGLGALWVAPSGVDRGKWQAAGGPFIKQQNFRDPWQNDYQYRMPGGEERDYDIFSYGADGREGGDGKNADIESWNTDGQGPTE